MSNSQELFIKLLQSKGLIKHGNFTLKSGIKSNLYINLRTMISDFELMEALLPLLKSHLSSDELSNIAIIGVPDGAIPIAVYLATVLKLKILVLPKQEKAHGDRIYSSYYQNSKIVLIEDVISTGSSVMETIKRLNSYGAQVVKVIAVVDRQMGARKNFEAHYPECNYESVITMEDIKRFCDI